MLAEDELDLYYLKKYIKKQTTTTTKTPPFLVWRGGENSLLTRFGQHLWALSF